MDNKTKERVIEQVAAKEKLRPLSRLKRLFVDPIHALPYYLVAITGYMRPHLISFRTPWGTKMKCLLPEGNTFYYYGYCEANLTNFFIRSVKEGEICLDVGAHIGFYTALFSVLAGPEGRVHSFEPTKRTYETLIDNTRGLANVVCNNLAVSDAEAELIFSDYGPGYGAYNSAHPGGTAYISRTPAVSKVRATTLDAYCAERGIRPDLIKIDTEGLEARVLKGTSALLSEGGPRPLVTIEAAGNEKWKENLQEAFERLRAASYDPYEIGVDGFIRPHALRQTYAYDNLVFMPSERIGAYTHLIRP